MPIFPEDDENDLDPPRLGFPELTVYPTDPEEVAVLYGPDGEPIATFYDRDVVPFGFQPPAQ